MSALLCSVVVLGVLLPDTVGASGPVTGWTTMSPLAPDGGPSSPGPAWSLSCPAAGACVAVGAEPVGAQLVGELDTLSDGTWSSAAAPSVNVGDSVELTSVSCAAVGSCTAVGAETDASGDVLPLVETLAAGAWTPSVLVVPEGDGTPIDAPLSAVSCPTASSCVALGTSDDAIDFTETEVAGSWTAANLASPAGDPFFVQASWGGLSCVGSGSCTAVADLSETAGFACDTESGLCGDAVVATLSGGTWTSMNAPFPSGDTLSSTNDALHAIQCTSSTSCVAVGDDTDATNTDQAFAATESDGTWSSAAPPAPSGTASGTLQSVACPADGTCVAVGSVLAGGHGGALIDEWSGDAWTDELAPLPPGATSGTGGLQAISCAAVDACVAVGQDDDQGTTAPWQPINETLSDDGWAPSAVVLPGNADVSGAGRYPDVESFGYAVTCPDASSCVGLGFYPVQIEPSSHEQDAELATYLESETAASLPSLTSSTSLSPSADPTPINGPVTYTATVSGSDGGGTVAFSDQGSTIPGCAAQPLVAAAGGYVATCTEAQAEDGTWIAAYYLGDATTLGSDDALTESIEGSAQSITFTSTPPTDAIVAGPGYEVTATGGGSTSPVVFASTTPSSCSVAGSAVTFVGLGTCTIQATQAGGIGYDAAKAVTQSFVVGPSPTSTTLTLSKPTVAYGAEGLLTFASTVTPLGALEPAGTVGVDDASGPVCAGAVGTGGQGSCALTATQLAPGAYVVTSSYASSSALLSGSSSHAADFTVTKARTALGAPSAVPVQSRRTWKLTVVVKLTSPTTQRALAAETLSVVLGGKRTRTCTTATSSTGMATCTFRGAGAFSILGAKSYVVSFAGTPLYLAARATGTVKRERPS